MPGMYAFTIFCGITSGSFQCLLPKITTSIAPRLDMVGTRLGMAFGIMSIASLAGSPLGGYLQASSGAFGSTTVWAATVSFAWFLLVVFTRYNKAGWTVSVEC